ncbi:diguanylate cyclase (GGDEF)-like protein [Streptomyces sp. SLBN-118]|uniref:GGDEF domain-containing protein n=1 Tax=Streptomyces sp. SLBN-118 TaxID=2768454 RepID=UPI0011534CA3|nr:GGDEF domain-containing protein [Streptomyces sp. SLBN-118]TQK44508.1 diguanylate cyclase (GGDEF)-like protein [Streptomyces sp. SLBN-118]
MGKVHVPLPSRREAVAWAYGAAGTAVIVTYLVTSSAARYMLGAVVSASVVFAIVVGVIRNKPPSVLPWCLLAAAMAPYAAADTIWGLYQVRGVEVPFPGVADWLYLGAYLLLAAGLVTLARQQAGRLHWAGLLDAGIITLGAGTLTWAFIIAPYLRSEMSAWPLAVSIAYPVTDLVLLSIAARLMLTTGTRTPSFLLVIGWLLVLLAADGLYYGTQATGTSIPEDVAEVGWMVSSLLLGAAALHSSVAQRTQMAQDQERLPPRRMSILIALILMGPLIVLANVGGAQDQPVNVKVIVAMMASLSLLLLLRIAFLAQYAQGRATEARTRATEARTHAEALSASLREQAELQKQLSHQATHDPLTGLANRALLNERLESVLGRCSAMSPSGLLMLDLDGFKDVNDTLGHPAGDELLVDVAQRLTARVRKQDMVARLGGDEFALLVDGVDASTLHHYTTRILDSFRDPFTLAHGHLVHMTTSIGARSITRPTAPSEALRDADTALYKAKTAGKNQAAFFEPPQQSSSSTAQEGVRRSRGPENS